MTEIVHNTLGGYKSKIGYPTKLLDVCLKAGVERAKLLCQRRRGYLSDISDAERIDKSFKSCRLRLLDSLDELCRRLLSHTVKIFDILGSERIQVRRVADKSRVKQKLNYLRSKTVNIHRALRREMLYTARYLRGTSHIRASYRNTVALVPEYRFTA